MPVDRWQNEAATKTMKKMTGKLVTKHREQCEEVTAAGWETIVKEGPGPADHANELLMLCVVIEL